MAKSAWAPHGLGVNVAYCCATHVFASCVKVPYAVIWSLSLDWLAAWREPCFKSCLHSSPSSLRIHSLLLLLIFFSCFCSCLGQSEYSNLPPAIPSTTWTQRLALGSNPPGPGSISCLRQLSSCFPQRSINQKYRYLYGIHLLSALRASQLFKDKDSWCLNGRYPD